GYRLDRNVISANCVARECDICGRPTTHDVKWVGACRDTRWDTKGYLSWIGPSGIAAVYISVLGVVVRRDCEKAHDDRSSWCDRHLFGGGVRRGIDIV